MFSILRKFINTQNKSRNEREIKFRGPPLLAVHGAAAPQWSERSFYSLSREGYTRNPIVYRAVRLIAEAVGSISILAYDKNGKEMVGHPLLELIANPNPTQTGPDFFEAIIGHLLLSGNAYLKTTVLNNEPREIYCMRPDRVKIVPGRNGWPEAYEYTVDGKTSRIPIRAYKTLPILHLKLFHPLSDYYGMPPMDAAQMSLDIHNAASEWSKSLLDNAARPSGALVYNGPGGSRLSDEQFDRLKKEIETHVQGASNAGRPLLLEGGLDWRNMSYSPKDMDFIEAKREAAREIALAFGIPPMLLGIPGDNTYANYQEANRVFWRQTALPAANRILKSLGVWLGGRDGVAFAIDNDKIEALSTERNALWQRVGAADFLTNEEKRHAVGYGLDTRE